MTVPASLTAGDTLKFTVELVEYDPSIWTLRMALANATHHYSVNGSSQNGLHLITATSAVTANWVAGDYSTQLYVSNSAGEQYTVLKGSMRLLPNLKTGPIDGRSHVKKCLDAICAVLEGRLAGDEASYQIRGRSITKLTPEELITAKMHYERLYQQELSENILSEYAGSRKKIRFHFRASGE